MINFYRYKNDVLLVYTEGNALRILKRIKNMFIIGNNLKEAEDFHIRTEI